MTGVFRRGLWDGFLQDLQDGPCSTILRAFQDAGLNVCLRENYLNAYFHGRSLAKIAGRRRQPAMLKNQLQVLDRGSNRRLRRSP